MSAHLDWSSAGTPAGVGDLAPCRICRRGALLREPGSGRPLHKICAEREIDAKAEDLAGRAV